jgi:hypothetical protein
VERNIHEALAEDHREIAYRRALRACLDVSRWFSENQITLTPMALPQAGQRQGMVIRAGKAQLAEHDATAFNPRDLAPRGCYWSGYLHSG